ncbi:MAG: hypothetical protein WCC39_08490 [Telluria sp.]
MNRPVVFVVGFTGSIVSTMVLWTTRRRLDAAITLLQPQPESSDSNASHP